MNLMNSGKVNVGADSIELVAGPKTDFFIDEMSHTAQRSAPFYFEEKTGDFVISAKVEPEFVENYDAGALFVYSTETCWIKLAFENTDLGNKSIVSVVTDGTSDDSNGENADSEKHVFLQIARKKDHWALHYSVDGRKWRMVRYFKLEMKGPVKVGFESQSPVGKGNKTLFTQIKIRDQSIDNMRLGE